MAEQRPLVLIDGDIQQLPVGDTTAGATGGVTEIVYAERVDFVGDTHLYKGWAQTGTIESSASWKIQKIAFVGADGDVVITWADGDANLDNIWDNRESLTYS